MGLPFLSFFILSYKAFVFYIPLLYVFFLLFAMDLYLQYQYFSTYCACTSSSAGATTWTMT